jgi:spermidine synthase
MSNNNIVNGWFHEKSSQWPGQAMSIEVDTILFEAKSKFQELLIFESKTWGTVFVLDGCIQLTDRDEFSYQEMLTHLPLFAHSNPKNICVIGGGDGGIVTQLIKHKSVESIHLCEIDQMVIDITQKHFPQFSAGFADPRLEIKVGDGLAYLSSLKEPTYDVIIVDSSDPVGPAESLFGKEFYESCKRALKEGGIVATQSESWWLHLPLIKELYSFAVSLFPTVAYAYTIIPTYPCGQIGFMMFSKEKGQDLSKPKRTPEEALTEKNKDSLRYYHSKIHEAAFVLPRFVQLALEHKDDTSSSATH